MRNEVELTQRTRGARQDLIDAVHEQRPAARRQVAEHAPCERSAAHLPAAACACNDARFDIFARGEIDQVPARDERARVRRCTAHEERLLLPVAPQKLRRIKAEARPKLWFHE